MSAAPKTLDEELEWIFQDLMVLKVTYAQAKTAIKASVERYYPPTDKVDRLEVIDHTGRAYVKGSIYGTPVSVELSYQDDNRTLKVFVTKQTTEVDQNAIEAGFEQLFGKLTDRDMKDNLEGEAK